MKIMEHANKVYKKDQHLQGSAGIAYIPLIRRFFILALIIIFTIGISGCKSKQWNNDPNNDPCWFTVTVVVSADGLDKSGKEEYEKKIHDKLEEDSLRMSAIVRFYPSETFKKLTRTNFLDLTEPYVFTESIN